MAFPRGLRPRPHVAARGPRRTVMTCRATGSCSRGPQGLRAGRGRHDRRPRPRAGRGRRAGAGVRRLPHRPALPRGRHQRRVPVPARPRGGRRGGGGRARRRPTTSRPGDFVILNWRAVCGALPVVPAGSALVLLLHAQRHAEDDARRRSRCRRRSASAPSPRRRWWPPGSARRSTRRSRPEVAGLLGCGVMAGLGAAMLTGEVQRGDSVAVFGCGGVGDAAIAGAVLAGASTIDRRRPRRPQARVGQASSAPPTRSTPRRRTPVEAVRAATGGNGADVCIEAVGNPKVFEQAFFARDLAGTLVQVGVPTPDMRIDLPIIELFGRGGRLKPSWYGDCLPEPRLPDARRPAPPGPAAARPVRVGDDRPRRGRGGVPQDGAGRGAALRRRALAS